MASLIKGLGWIASTHMAVHSTSWGTDALSWPLWVLPTIKKTNRNFQKIVFPIPRVEIQIESTNKKKFNFRAKEMQLFHYLCYFIKTIK